MKAAVWTERDRVEVGQPPGVEVFDVRDLDVLEFDLFGRERRYREKRKAGQAGHDVPAVDELWERHPQPGELGIDDPETAHGK